MHLQSTIRRRRERQWVPTADKIETLRRSARQLARRSASRISPPPASECLARYRYVTAVEHACKLIRGDLLVELIDAHGLRAIDIARLSGERPGDLSQMYTVAKTFPLSSRPTGARYNHLLLATRMARKFPTLGFTPALVLDEIHRTGFTQHRDVTRHFSALMHASMTGKARHLPDLRGKGQRFNFVHAGCFQELLPTFRDGAIKVLAIDAPYVYGDRPYRSRSARSFACDNNDPAAALSLVVDLLRDWQPKLAPGGVVLLWQPWQPLLARISDAMQSYRWAVIGPIIWDKERTQPGCFTSPYSTHGELIWVLHRSGDDLVNHDGSSRGMILPYRSVNIPNGAPAQAHAFEKPVGLCEMLLRKHSNPGDIVFDACGCTGSMSVAAVNLGRRWVYAESNPENFALGEGRIAAAAAKVAI